MVVLLEAKTPGTLFEFIHINIARVLQALPEQGTYGHGHGQVVRHIKKQKAHKQQKINYAL
jgi:hypothetical protein